MLDTDSNGLVSLAEFLAPAEEHFTSLDANDDNLLSMAEFVAPAETHFNQLDVDGDGQLSQDEFHPRQPRPRGNGGGPRRNGAMGGAVGR